MKGTLIKVRDTGTNDPFVARMMFGIMKLRDAFIHNETDRLEFDSLYASIFDNLDDCLSCGKQLEDLIVDHKNKLKSKEVVGFQNNGEILEIHESIDREMSKLFKDFFIKGEIALKSLQKLSLRYGLNIGFFFQDDKKFLKGAGKLTIDKTPHSAEIAKMLTEDRKWHSAFNEIRIAIEHGGLTLGNIKYQNVAGGEVIALIPKINNVDLNEVVNIMSSNVSDFIEDVIAMTASRNIKRPFCVIEIPQDKRDPSLPIKYTVGIVGIPSY